MWNKVNQRISEALANIRNAFRSVTASTDSSAKVQMLQLQALKSESLDGAEYFQHFGFTSNPPPGCMAIVLPLNGETSHSIVIATEHGAYRFKELAPGEVALYTPEGASVVLKQGKVIESTCSIFRVLCDEFDVQAKTKAAFTTPELSTSGEFIAEGQISGNGGMAIKGGDGDYTATFEGNINHTSGVISSVDVTINGIKIGPHLHDTPDGKSGPPING